MFTQNGHYRTVKHQYNIDNINAGGGRIHIDPNDDNVSSATTNRQKKSKIGPEQGFDTNSQELNVSPNHMKDEINEGKS